MISNPSVMSGAVAILTDLLNSLSPGVAIEQASAATTIAWGAMDIPAGAVRARVKVKAVDAYVTPKLVTTTALGGADPAQNGSSYAAVGTWDIPCRGGLFLLHTRDGVIDGTIEVTFFAN